jgi:DNA-directed RNA polymerase specialized sigma24 family protein
MCKQEASRVNVSEDEAMKHDNETKRPDEEHARLAAAGDATAFGEIHDRHRGRVYIARRITGNEADAEDLTHTFFVGSAGS